MTIYCARDHFEALVLKIERSLAEPEMEVAARQVKIEGREDTQVLVWRTVEKEIRDLFKSRHATESIVDRAIVFGLPLDDTVFMLTPTAGAGGAIEQHMFGVELGAGSPSGYAIDFYSRI
jgi:hypothetical protein